MPATVETAKAAEKQEVKGYFETTGFDRWNRIYSESDDVNKVQRNIRIGHQKTVDNVLAWLKEQGNLASRSFCDAGCGVGSLTLPLALCSAGRSRCSMEYMAIQKFKAGERLSPGPCATCCAFG